MRITAIETLHVEAYSNLVWVRLHTDAGLVGLGEAFRNPKATIAYIHETCAPYLLGKDPRQVARHADALANRVGNRFVGYPTRSVELRGNSAVDIALWDLLGKALGVPLHQLLGGLCRDSIRIYNTCASDDYNRIARSASLSRGADERPAAARPLDDLHAQIHRPEELAHELLEEGISAMKIWPFDRFAAPDGQDIEPGALRRGLEPVRRIREAVGERMEILMEYHALWQLPAIRRIAEAVDAYGVYWHEDPVPMESFDDLAAFKRSTRARVAGSESLGTRAWYKEAFARGAIDVAHFDLGWVGGITEGRKLAALAETHHRPIAPHDCTGPLQYVASLHLALSAPNALFQETVRAFCRGYYTEVVTELPAIGDGRVHPLSGPGLGTELQPGLDARDDAHRATTRLGDL